MVSFDGSGTVAGTRLYLDGSTTPLPVAYQEDNLVSSILNNEPLRVGFNLLAGNSFMQGEIGFVEIFDTLFPGGVHPAIYSEYRWNGGEPIRATPEPTGAVLALFAFVGLLLWRRRLELRDGGELARFHSAVHGATGALRPDRH